MGLEAWPCVKEGLPFVLMLMMEFGDVCTTTLGKAAMSSGMSKWVFVVYYNALGTLILLPFFVLHRHRFVAPPSTFRFLILLIKTQLNEHSNLTGASSLQLLSPFCADSASLLYLGNLSIYALNVRFYPYFS